jgi:16S rRNA processing protein RimM
MKHQSDSSLSSEQPWVVLARLVRPQGRHGELLADILTDFPERFSERHQLVLLPGDNLKVPSRDVTLETHWLHKGRVVLKFAGVDSISDAEALRGMDVAIPREQRASLEDDSVYISDLIGCQVFDISHGEPNPVGEITDVDREITSTPLLILRPTDGRQEELLVPFAKAYLRHLDLEKKRIEMSLPEGLLTINSPLTKDETTGNETA